MPDRLFGEANKLLPQTASRVDTWSKGEIQEKRQRKRSSIKMERDVGAYEEYSWH